MAGSAHWPLRLAHDASVVVAGLLWNGPPRRLIELAIEGETVELSSSAVVLDELPHALGYSKLDKRIEGFGTSTSGAGGAVHRARQPGGAGQRAASGGQRWR